MALKLSHAALMNQMHGREERMRDGQKDGIPSQTPNNKSSWSKSSLQGWGFTATGPFTGVITDGRLDMRSSVGLLLFVSILTLNRLVGGKIGEPTQQASSPQQLTSHLLRNKAALRGARAPSNARG